VVEMVCLWRIEHRNGLDWARDRVLLRDEKFNLGGGVRT
jgi:hypothetical protein